MRRIPARHFSCLNAFMNLKRKLCGILLLAGAAVVVLLVLRRHPRTRADQEAEQPGATAAWSVTAQAPDAVCQSEDQPPESPRLRGLRLVDSARIPARTTASQETTDERIRREVRQKWADVKVDLNYCDEPLEKVVAEVSAKTGLSLRIDPVLDASLHTVTFKVSELAADQALSLILMMADVAWAIDARGDAWVTTKDRVSEYTGVDPLANRVLKFSRTLLLTETSGEVPVPGRVRRPVADKRISVSLVHKPLREALDQLQELAGEKFHFSEGIGQLLDRAPVVSLIEEDIRVEDALSRLLGTSGLTYLDLFGGMILTTTEAEYWVDIFTRSSEVDKERARELSDLRRRRVAVKGELMTLAEVAAQVSVQVGMPVRLELDRPCAAYWESDGLEQSLGEVLDLLAEGGGAAWRWGPEVDPDTYESTEPMIWFLSPYKK